jgi:thiol-disulfide isomerase/thioredoxin
MKFIAFPFVALFLSLPVAFPVIHSPLSPAASKARAMMRNVNMFHPSFSSPNDQQDDQDNDSEPLLLPKGARAPDFTVRDLKGHPVKLSSFKGKVVLIDFWATWCEPCQETLPDTNAVAREFKSKNVEGLAINVWDTPDAFQQWLPQHKQDSALKFVIDRNNNGRHVTDLYHVSGIPTQYVIDKRGRVSASFVAAEKEDLEHALKVALVH